MDIVPWQPTPEALVEGLIREVLGFPRVGFEPLIAVPMDLVEVGEGYVLQAELPGLRREDLRVEVKGPVLTVRGVKRPDARLQGRTHHLGERGFGAFERHFRISDNIDVEAISARLADGLLTLMLPRKSASAGRDVPIG